MNRIFWCFLSIPVSNSPSLFFSNIAGPTLIGGASFITGGRCGNQLGDGSLVASFSPAEVDRAEMVSMSDCFTLLGNFAPLVDATRWQVNLRSALG